MNKKNGALCVDSIPHVAMFPLVYTQRCNIIGRPGVGLGQAWGRQAAALPQANIPPNLSTQTYHPSNAATAIKVFTRGVYTVRKEIKCSGETEILHELVHDTTRKPDTHEQIRLVS